MAFYYTSILSIVPLGIAYLAAALVYGGIWWLSRGAPQRASIRIVAAAVLLVLPVSEELWIAWRFGQACKEAGTFITRKVQADGFYDDTMRSAYENTSRSGYRFVEQRTEDRKAIERVERGDRDSAAKALAWYAEQNPGKPYPPSVIYPVQKNVQIVVFPKTGELWAVTRLDRPTARYHFKHTDPMNGTPWGYKVIRFGSVVVDSKTNEEVARYTGFARNPPWFFVGLDTPGFACDSPGNWPYTRKSRLIYRDVLIPAGRG